MSGGSNSKTIELVGRRPLLFLTARSLGTFAALLLLPSTACIVRAQEQIAADDPRIKSERVAIKTDWGSLDCYLARPAADTGHAAGVIVAHDKWGLTRHVEDVTRSLAVEGFVALAPDYASRFGGTPAEAGPAMEVVGMASWSDMIADTRTAAVWLMSGKRSSGKIGAIGLGLGGTAIGRVITSWPDLKAAVIFYGHPPPETKIAGIETPLLMNLAGKDPLVGPDVPAAVEALMKAGASYEIYVYDNTERGFDDDTASAHYVPEAARLAWSRTIAFLKEKLD
jgi:carboxymethylenebutenolidase